MNDNTQILLRQMQEILEQATRHKRASELKRTLLQDLDIIERMAVFALNCKPAAPTDGREGKE